jgi:hypothetical protein
MSRSKHLLCLLAFLFIPRAVPAWGYMMTYHGDGLNQAVKIGAPGMLADGKTVHAGQMLISYQDNDYIAWCVDLDAYAGTADVTEISYLSLPNASAVAYLYDMYADGTTTSLESAALAVSLWEVLAEPPGGPFNVNSGNFRISQNAAVAARAAVMLASVPASYTPLRPLTVLHSQTKQDMLIGGFGSPIPEACTLSLLCAGMVISAKRRRWKHG